MEIKFSIITPSLNQGKYIRDTIESVNAQCFENIEHIIVDGCSTDSTISILKTYPGLKWISEPDTGAANAINKGFRMAKGDIVAWLNADDYYDKNVFKEVAKIFNENDKIELVYGNLTFVDEEKQLLHKDKTGKYDIDFLIHKNADIIRQPCSFFKKSLFEKVGGLDETLKCVFDYDLFVKMFLITKPVYIDRNFAYYREHGNTLTRKYIKKQGMEIIKVSRKYGAKFYDKIVLKNFVKKVLFSKYFYK